MSYNLAFIVCTQSKYFLTRIENSLVLKNINITPPPESHPEMNCSVGDVFYNAVAINYHFHGYYPRHRATNTSSKAFDLRSMDFFSNFHNPIAVQATR